MPDRVLSIAFTPDARRIAIGLRGGTIRLFDLAGSAPGATLEGEFAFVDHLAFSPDGARLASDTILWDADAARPLARLSGNDDRPAVFAWSPDARTLFTASLGADFALWDADPQTRPPPPEDPFPTKLPRAEPIARGPSGQGHVFAARFLARAGGPLVTAGSADTIVLRNPRSGAPEATLPGPGFSEARNDFGFALRADGRLLAAEGAALRLYRLPDSESVHFHVVATGEGSARMVAWTDDGHVDGDALEALTLRYGEDPLTARLVPGDLAPAIARRPGLLSAFMASAAGRGAPAAR